MPQSCSRCPTCNRAIRRKRIETPEDAHKRIDAKTRAGIHASLRKPMPARTRYRD